MPPRSAALISQLYRLTSPPSSNAELLGRWLRSRDEEAFAALVARHGAMVFGLCRRILGNNHDAEDAFQAVFLILARKAGSLRHPEALAGWLHGVAVRLACKARAARNRRTPVSSLPDSLESPDTQPEPLDLLSARELLSLIDEEIARLPEVYRLPLVLCDLEERTQEEAARLLGWTPGSLRGRLLRGRARLRARLLRRSVAPAALVAAGVARKSAHAVVPAALSASVSRLAASSDAVSSAVAVLMRDGLHALMAAKLKFLSAVLLAVGALAAGAGLLAQRSLTPQETQEPAANEAPPAANPPAQPAKKSDIRRDQVGDPLPADAIARLGTTRLRHGGIIEALGFSADGKTLVSCGWDSLRFWDAATGAEIHRFPDRLQAHHMATSPDGKLLALMARRNKPEDEPIEIRELAAGRLLRRFGRAQIPFFGPHPSRLLFSPNGKVLAAFRISPEITLWNPANGDHLRTLKGHTDAVWSIAFSADSQTLISVGDDRAIRFWDVASGKQIRQIAHAERLGNVALSPDGKLLALIDTIKQEYLGWGTWHADRRVRIWDAAAGKELRQLTMPAQQMTPAISAGFMSLCFAPDGKTLLTGGLDGVLRIWDPTTGKELRHFSGFAGSPGVFTFAPDGKSLALVEGSSTIRLLNIAGGKDLVARPGHNSPISSLILTPDCQSVVTTGYDGTLRFWGLMTGRELRRRTVATGYPKAPQLLADASGYLTVGPDHRFHVHDLVTGEERAVLRGHDARYPYFALSPDRKLLASVDANTIVLLDPATGEVRRRLPKLAAPVSGMDFTPDGRVLVVWTADRAVSIWDAATGEKRRQFAGPTDQAGPPAAGGGYSAFTAALSPDGKLLAFGLQSGGRPGVLLVVKISTGEEVRRFTTATDGVSELTFSPDGQSLAWGGWSEGTVYLGEIATGGERRRFPGHRGRIAALAFSPDGKTLISGSEDTTALVWDLTGRLTSQERKERQLSCEETKKLWDTLAQRDASSGFRAIQALVADPERSIPFLRTHLNPIPAVDEGHLKQWIADLGSDVFAAREKAAMELEKQGQAALHALRQALNDRPALETRRRLEQLIDKAERDEWASSPDQLRTRRALEVLERAGTPEARRVLEMLAGGAPGAWRTLDAKAALTRLARR